jgi:hypothetical protein
MPASVNRIIKKRKPVEKPGEPIHGPSLARSGRPVIVVVGFTAGAALDPREAAVTWGHAATREATATRGEGRIREQGTDLDHGRWIRQPPRWI